jgi:hypothetical protein
MTSLARFVALLFGAALVACTWAPWAGANRAFAIPFKTLWDPSAAAMTLTSYLFTVAFALWLAGAVVIVGAILGSRAMVVIGALLAVATSTAWVLSNAISSAPAAVAMTNVRVGAYTAIVVGLATLLLAALSRDTAVPTAR